MHKHLLLATVATFASLGLAGTASASSYQGWYGSAELGLNIAADEDGVNDTLDTAFAGWTHTAEWDTGWAVIGAIGYSFGNIRTELELGYRANDLDRFGSTGGFNDNGGDISHFTVMANALYDHKITDDYEVSVGGGIGIDNINYDNTSGWHTPPTLKDSDTFFAWQLIAGVSRPMPSWGTDVFMNYRYTQTEDLSFRELDGGGDLHNDDYDNLSNHTITVGVRFQ
jgi:Outer membrane protein beta-barrel domain